MESQTSQQQNKKKEKKERKEKTVAFHKLYSYTIIQNKKGSI